MRWLALGVQGALLSHVFAGPVALASLTVSAEQSGNAMERAHASAAVAADVPGASESGAEQEGAAIIGGSQRRALQRALLTRCGAERSAAAAAFDDAAAPEPALAVVAVRFAGGRAETTLRAAAAAATSDNAGLALRGQKRLRDAADTGDNGGECAVAGAEAAPSPSPSLSLSHAVRSRVVGGSGSGALVVPCPISLVAVAPGVVECDARTAAGAWAVEVVAGTAGTVHGATRAASPSRRASRFCKARAGAAFAELWGRYCIALGAAKTAASHGSYLAAKRCGAHVGCARFNRARAAFHCLTGKEGTATAVPILSRGWLFGEHDLEAFPLRDAALEE